MQFYQASYPPANAEVPYPEAAEVVVGDDYYQTVQFLPPGMSKLCLRIVYRSLFYRYPCDMGPKLWEG